MTEASLFHFSCFFAKWKYFFKEEQIKIDSWFKAFEGLGNIVSVNQLKLTDPKITEELILTMKNVHYKLKRLGTAPQEVLYAPALLGFH